MHGIKRAAGAPRGFSRLLVLHMVGVSLVAAYPAAAEVLPNPSELAGATAEERRLLAESLSQMFEGGEGDAAAALIPLDQMLVKLKEPTKLRGFVQFLRAQALAAQERDAAAREAIDESIRLLPGYSAPLMSASRLYTYADQPGPAADYLMRASEIDPHVVREVDEYDIDSLFHRLSAQRDKRRAKLLSERLLKIGWLGNSLGSRSRLALYAISARMEEGDVTGARGFVTKLILPEHFQTLLIQNRYRDLWPDIEQWAGRELEKQWPI